MPRKYQLKQRAKGQEQTRQRIVEAAVDLHESVGPARTTVTAIAEQAGVGRLTVYRHFPDELSLIWACSSHYWERHPFPDPEAWRGIDDPQERFRTALAATYSYHRETEEMMSRAMADVGDSPVWQPYFDHWHRVADGIVSGWPAKESDRKLLVAAVSHALAFTTWKSLVRHQSLSEPQAIALMLRLTCDCE